MTTPTHPAPAIDTGSPTAPVEGRIAASIDAWKRKLLDLSKRNRALNFRATRVSTVAIVDEHPAEIFRTLYLAEREMRFRGTESEPAAEAAPDAAGSTSAEPDAELDTVGSLKPHYADPQDAKWGQDPCRGSAKRPVEEGAPR